MNKSLAFASTSHDIRTSLAGIIGLVGICLADAPRVSELHSNMQQINTRVTKFLGILNSVLDISKIEAGKMQPEEVRLLGGEIKIMDKTSTEKGICFRFNILLKSCKPSDANVDDESRAERSSSLPTNTIIIKDSANSQIVQSTILSMGFRKGLASDSIHAILFVQGDENTRIMQRWMEISGVEVWVIDHWRLIYSITEKIKNRLGCLGRSKSRSLASLLTTAAEFSHSKDKFLPLSDIEFKTSSKDYTSSCVLIVIDFSHGNFPEIELTLKTLITDNESLHFKIVWLVNSNAPTNGLRRSKHVSCHLILQKSIHGSRRYALSRLIQDFGRESEHDLHKMPSYMESNKFASNSSSFQCSSHEVFSSSLNLEHKPLNGMNIFLAEDVPILQQVATKLISRLGASVTSCENGLNALDLIRDALRKLDSTHEGNASNDSKGFPYDAILMDCEMPFMNGYEATRLIREEERNYSLRIPIIALTAHVSPEEERKTALAEMNFHLTKPLQANQLLHVINTVIKESI
ncbi:probable histidine kinase 2 [Zingiber officinale]|uniref:probable histidine kinase 2 n=1 Tax=Zingiber officinale TaxID=94328 RepID=UPI001C4D8C0B|nr:probable histidine kinase 2 [Zingiber officinale]